MPSSDEREIARHYTLSTDDLDQVAAKRGDANRLGYAIVLLYLRYDYAWNADDQPGPGQLRPLRTKPSLLAA